MIVVDRIEGERAVLEIEGEMVVIPARALPTGVGEGAMLVFAQADERAVREHAEARLARLRERGNPGEEIAQSDEVEL